jgi:phosphocarrier protein HPr
MVFTNVAGQGILMIEKEVTIINQAGMHTRPASAIVKIAAKYKAEFYLSKNGFEVNGKSIIGVMTLAAEQGSKLLLKFDGEDEEQLAEEMIAFFEKGFNEV